MKKIFLILLFSLLAASTVEAANWTFAVYLDADNNLESAGIDDLNEMELAGSTGNVNIIVQFDRASGYDSTNGDWTSARRYYVTQDSNTNTINSTLIQDLGEVDMASVSTLVDFINWTVNTYPAQNYAVVLWNHGSGWKSSSMTTSSDSKKEEIIKPKIWEDEVLTKSNNKGIIWDDSSSNSLSLQEVRQAFEQANGLTGVKLDIIGMDACLMQMAEVGYELRNHSDILVGSEETEPGDGWDYNGSLSYLINNPAASSSQLASQIVSNYFNQYGTSGDETQSAVDQTNMVNLRQSIDTFAQSMINGLPTFQTQIQNARSNSYEYSGDTDYIDLYHFTSLVQSGVSDSTIQTAAVNLMAAINTTVLAEMHGSSASDSHGISIYYPTGSVLSSYNTTLFAQDGLWDQFLNNISYVAPDSYENDNNYTIANWITSDGNAQTHNIAPAGDIDYIKFNATSNHTYIIQTFNLSYNADTYLYLYSTDGQSNITEDDDGGSETYASMINWTCSSTGTYYAAVEDYYSTASGGVYSIYINDTTPTVPDTTPPASVTNLNYQSVGTTWIYWNWTNPSDVDFSASIIYLDNNNVANTSNNDYNATGLNSGTNYTLRINTKDTTGNINYTNITSTASTLTISCTPNLTNTSWTAWYNVSACLSNDTTQQARNLTQYDANNCGGANQTYYEYQSISCNYCSYNITNTSWSDWQNQGVCLINDTGTMNRSKIEYDANYNSCYAVTALPSDLWNNGTNITHWEFNYSGCDYCQPNPVNTSLSAWQNQTSCLINDTQIQNRSILEYDANYSTCYAVTNLASDLWNNGNNNTYWEFQSLTCDYCTPSWYQINTSCASNDQFTSWYNDSNSCYTQTSLASDNNPPSNTTNYCDFDSNGIIGTLSSVNTTLTINMTVNGSSDLSQNCTGVEPIIITESSQNLIEFNYDFSTNTLNLFDLMIEKQPGASTYAYLIIQGLDLTSQSRTKTVYLDMILNGTGLCIKDTSTVTLSEISSTCKGSGETWIACPGSSGAYSCSINGSQYQIAGLSHSGVKELATYCGDSSCNGGETCSSCSADCGSCPGGGSSPSSTGPSTRQFNTTKNDTTITQPEPVETPAPENKKTTTTKKPPIKKSEPVKPIEEENKGLFSITGAFAGNLKKSLLIVVPVVLLAAIILGSAYVVNSKKINKRKKRRKLKWLLIPLVLIVVIIALSLFFISRDRPAAVEDQINLDSFAQCLEEQMVTYYGYSGDCPSCRKQEALFGDSFQYLKFVDCAADRQRCNNENAVFVPSWRIDWTIHSGLLTLKELSELSSCPLN